MVAIVMIASIGLVGCGSNEETTGENEKTTLVRFGENGKVNEGSGMSEVGY